MRDRVKTIIVLAALGFLPAACDQAEDGSDPEEFESGGGKADEGLSVDEAFSLSVRGLIDLEGPATRELFDLMEPGEVKDNGWERRETSDSGYYISCSAKEDMLWCSAFGTEDAWVHEEITSATANLEDPGLCDAIAADAPKYLGCIDGRLVITGLEEIGFWYRPGETGADFEITGKPAASIYELLAGESADGLRCEDADGSPKCFLGEKFNVTKSYKDDSFRGHFSGPPAQLLFDRIGAEKEAESDDYVTRTAQEDVLHCFVARDPDDDDDEPICVIEQPVSGFCGPSPNVDANGRCHHSETGRFIPKACCES